MIKQLLYILFIALTSGISYSQVTDLGGPIGWSKNLSPVSKMQVYSMPSFKIADLIAEDEINDKKKDAPWRFGFKHMTSISVEGNSDGWISLENGDRVWRTEIKSTGALSINLILENVFIPDGASLYLYDIEQTNRVGAYTSRNNRDDGILGTELVIGEHIVVEYFEPKELENRGHFTIAEVIHGYRNIKTIQDELEKGINDSGDCNYDVNCPLGNGWEDQIRSVAMIIVNGNGICTGALVNNTCEDGRPLILSANHCLSLGTSTWSFRFNWASPPGTESCATVAGSVDPGGPYDETANGATVLANGTEADHLLLEVDNMTVADAIAWNLYYSGWNHNDNAIVTEATCIHHPLGDVMKITREDDSPFHSLGASAQVWWINSWELGTTHGGSSGAPLYDQNGRIIGQLFGGQAGCSGTNNNGLYDYFGRMGVAWDYGFSEHLAPLSCAQALVLDGWDPNAPIEVDDASAESISSPDGQICSITFIPEVSIRNAGDNDLTSCTLTYNIDGGTNFTYNWTGLLGPNDSEMITLPSMTSTNGAHTFYAFTSDPNATTDTDTGNDTIVNSFTLFENTVATFINISTDCYGYETAWELHDSLSSLVASGGNVTVPPGGNQSASSSDPGSYGNGTQITEKLCLAEGCYDFTVYDDWGDGLEGTNQPGCNIDGDYEITSSSGFVYGSMQNVAFGVSETITVCVSVGAGIDEFSIDDFHLFPNPSDGLIHISLNNTSHSDFKLKVGDLSGRVVYESKLVSNLNTIDLRNIAAGSYLFSIDTGNTIITKKVIINN